MKRIFSALILTSIMHSAWAEEKSTTRQTEEAIRKGAEATEQGIEKAIEAAKRGVEKGVAATERGVKKADEWIGEKLQTGGQKLEKASE